MATLEIILPSGPAREEPLPTARVRIGRSPENDIAIPDPSVSRVHATLEPTAGGFIVSDLGSRNGVLVNGERISGPTRIGWKDEIGLGDVILKLKGEADVTLTDAPFQGRTDTTVIAYEPETDLGHTTLMPFPLGAPEVQRPGADSILTFFQEVTNAVIAARPFDDVLEEIVRQLLNIVPEADRACLLLLEGQPPELKPRVARHRSGRAAKMNVSRTIVSRAVANLDSILSENAQMDQRFSGTESLVVQGTFSVMCAPLVIEKRAIGVLYVDTLSPFKHFDRDQLRLFATLGNIAAGHIQRQGLLEEAILRRAYERELAQAATIQQRLLSVPPVDRAGYVFHATNRPCLAVGGDYYDLIDCGAAGVVLAIGDVCGKGMGAALLMSTVQATVRAEVRVGGGPLAICQRVNSTLYASTDRDKFVTLFLAHLDPANGRLTYVNAGHDAPILIRGGSDRFEHLAATGLVAGVIPDAPLESATVDLGPGDILYAYTDGLREAQRPDGDEFGEERLVAAVLAHRDLPPADLVHSIEAEVFAFTEGGEQGDDMTQLLVRRQA